MFPCSQRDFCEWHVSSASWVPESARSRNRSGKTAGSISRALRLLRGMRVVCADPHRLLEWREPSWIISDAFDIERWGLLTRRLCRGPLGFLLYTRACHSFKTHPGCHVALHQCARAGQSNLNSGSLLSASRRNIHLRVDFTTAIKSIIIHWRVNQKNCALPFWAIWCITRCPMVWCLPAASEAAG